MDLLSLQHTTGEKVCVCNERLQQQKILESTYCPKNSKDGFFFWGGGLFEFLFLFYWKKLYDLEMVKLICGLEQKKAEANALTSAVYHMGITDVSRKFWQVIEE